MALYDSVTSSASQKEQDIGYPDPALQKGFLSDINGVMEHILLLNSILYNAKDHSPPLFMTFVDLRNAFGSIHHQLITDMLSLVGVPNIIISYVSDIYSKLSGSVSTRLWQIGSFVITSGVFQGDTLSPLLFVLFPTYCLFD